MELQQLEYFLDASESLSFAKTADSFGVSRQAISFAMKNLENELRMQLFERSHNKVSLTPQALDFAERARETLSYFEIIRDSFQNQSECSCNSAMSAICEAEGA